MRPREVPNEVPRGFWAGGMAKKRVGPEEGKKKRAEKREKINEIREKIAASLIHCIFIGPRGHLEKVMKIRGGHRNRHQLDSLHFYRVP